MWMPVLHAMLQHCHPHRGICHAADQKCSQGSSKQERHGAPIQAALKLGSLRWLFPETQLRAWDDVRMMSSNVYSTSW